MITACDGAESLAPGACFVGRVNVSRKLYARPYTVHQRLIDLSTTHSPLLNKSGDLTVGVSSTCDQTSAHGFLHQRADPCLCGGVQLLQREGDRPQGAFVELRYVAEA